MKLSEIASAVEARLEGQDVEITGVTGIQQAGPGELTFVANPRYAGAAKTTKASAVIVAEDFPALETPTLRSANPYLAFARALELFYQPPRYAPGIHSTAVIHNSARIGVRAHIGAYVVVDEDVEIGEDCVLLPHVVVYRGARIGDNFFAHAHAVVREYCRLGDNVVLQNGAVVGGDGFGFAKDDAGAWHKIVQSGPAVAGRRRGNPGQRLRGPRQRGRDPRPARGQDRQPGAGRTRLDRRRRTACCAPRWDWRARPSWART